MQERLIPQCVCYGNVSEFPSIFYSEVSISVQYFVWGCHKLDNPNFLWLRNEMYSDDCAPVVPYPKSQHRQTRSGKSEKVVICSNSGNTNSSNQIHYRGLSFHIFWVWSCDCLPQFVVLSFSHPLSIGWESSAAVVVWRLWKASRIGSHGESLGKPWEGCRCSAYVVWVWRFDKAQ